jgi:phospholipase C
MAKPLTDRIEHAVVLMLENRSFDNVLGGLYPDLTKKGLYRGLRGSESNPLDPANTAKGSVTVFQGPATLSTWIMPYPDPGELYSDMVQQIFGSNSVPSSTVLAPMSGFAWNYTYQPWSISGEGWPSVGPVPRNIMQYYSEAAMPATAGLAKAFAVCDCWFAAAPVQTIANRVLAHCGTPSKLPNTNTSRVNNYPDVTVQAETGLREGTGTSEGAGTP